MLLFKPKYSSFCYSWVSPQENHETSISISKRHPLSSRPFHLSRTLRLFLFSSMFFSSLALRSTAEPYQPLPAALLRRKHSPLPPFFFPLSLALHTAFSLCLLPAFPNILFNHLSTLSQLYHTQQRTNRSSTSSILRRQIRRFLPLLTHLVKQLASIPLIHFAFKGTIKPQARTYFMLTTQFSYFQLFHCATHSTHVLLPLLRDRALHFFTASQLRTFSATTNTSSFCRTTLRALTRLRTPA